MTTKQRETLEAAVERAMDAGLEVIGQGHLKAGNGTTRVFLVPSQSDPTRTHVVRLVGRRLQCDCTASQYGRICAHRATVHMELVVEASRREAEADDVTAALEREAVAIERKDRQEAEQQTERTRKREAAVLVSSSAPFSIWR